MIILAAMALGIGWGIYTARKRNGNRLDMAQYAFGYGVAFTLLGLVATIAVDRLAG